MERIAIVGTSWRQDGPQGLARFTIPPEERAARLPGLAQELGVEELVYLATCNRVEVAVALSDPRALARVRRALYGVLSGGDAAPGEAERTLRAWAGEGAAEHLFLVAAGLDSARLGETEISGQVKTAIEQARALGLAGRRLGPLFDEALKISRRVRGATGIDGGRTSLAEIAVDAVRERLQVDGTPRRVALVGVSPMTRRCGVALRGAGLELVVANRTLSRAEELCGELGSGARAVALGAFLAEPGPLAALVSATSSPEPLLGRDELARLTAARTLLVDLAVPPDVDPDAARALALERLGMEEVLAVAERTRAARALELGDARTLVDEALDALRRRWRGRAVDAALVALRAHYAERALDELEKSLQRDLRAVGEAERDALRAYATRVANALAHLPTSGLREIVAEHGAPALEAFLRGAEPGLARALNAALEAPPEALLGTIPDDEEELA